MDMVVGLGLLVRDVLDADSDLSKFVDKLRVLLFRVERLFEETVFDTSENIEKLMYKSSVDRAKSLITETEEKLKNMGIARKISMNLPFDKTKANLKESIEELEKASIDLKERQLNHSQTKRSFKKQSKEENDTDQLEQKTLKKSKKQQTTKLKQLQFDPTLVEQAPSPMMLATLEQKQGFGGSWVEITFELNGPEELMKIVKQDKNSLQLEKMYFRFQIDKTLKPQQLVMFNRKYFKSCYEKARKTVVQIDFISSKNNHFELVFKRAPEDKKQPIDVNQIIVTTAKECIIEQKRQITIKRTNSFSCDQFLSFPQKTLEHLLPANIDQYKLMLVNNSKDGTYVKRADTEKWELIETQTSIRHNDEICPLMKKPLKVQPSFWFKVSLEQILL